MKLTKLLPLVVALSFTAAANARAEDMKTADPKTMHGMEMKPGKETKHMDMDHCKHMKGMDMKDMDAKKCKEMMGTTKAGQSPAHAGMHAADGVVKDVDATGKVTLQHGPVKSLGWPAMSMGFAVKDKALLPKLAVGSKVHVEFDKQGSDYVITSVK